MYSEYFEYFINAIIVLLILLLVMWLMASLGLYWIAKAKGNARAWFAFLPLVNLCLLADLTDESGILGKRIPNLKIILPIAQVSLMIISGVPIVGGLLWVVWSISLIMLYYEVFKNYMSTVAAILFAVFLPCVGFLIAGIQARE